jgi:hypothetical protein
MRDSYYPSNPVAHMGIEDTCVMSNLPPLTVAAAMYQHRCPVPPFSQRSGSKETHRLLGQDTVGLLGCAPAGTMVCVGIRVCACLGTWILVCACTRVCLYMSPRVFQN